MTIENITEQSERTVHSAPDPERYRSFDTVSFRVGPGSELVYSRLSGEARILSTEAAQVLRDCQTFNSLKEHIGRLCDKPTHSRLSMQRIEELLREFANSGLLVAEGQILREIVGSAKASASTPGVSFIGIPTRDRVQTLRRAVLSYLTHLQACGRPMTFVISDSSENPEVRNQTRAILRDLDRTPEYQILYAGWEEKARFANRLIQHAGVPPEIVHFALFNEHGFTGSAGCSRNVLLLQTTGAKSVQVDDDTICQIAQVPGQSGHVALTSEPDPSEFWFFPDWESAVQAGKFVDRDFLTLHEQFLGEDLGSCVSSLLEKTTVDMDRMNSSFVRRLQGGTGQIRVTCLGVIGDSGIGRPGAYLFFDGKSLERLTDGQENYRRFLSSRQVLRAATRVAINEGTFCTSANMGLDNRTLLPPFAPVHRASEIVFASIIRTCFPATYFSFLPWAVVHAAPEMRAHARRDVFANFGTFRANDFMEMLIGSFNVTPHIGEPTQRLKALGAHLMEIGRMRIQDFEEYVRSLVWRSATRQLAFLEMAVRQYGSTRDYWAEDVRKAMDVYRSALTSRYIIAPSDIVDPAPIGQTLSRLVFQFGELLQSWPELVQASADLLKNSELLAHPV